MPYSIKKWDGGSWVDSPINKWNGSSWVAVPVFKWNGSSWVNISLTTYQDFWSGTASRSYIASGAATSSEPYKSSYLMFGYNSATLGNQRSICNFDIAYMRTKLAGSIIISNFINIFLQHSYLSTGTTVHLGTNTNTGLPTTFTGSYSTSDATHAFTARATQTDLTLPNYIGERFRDSVAGSIQVLNPNAGTSTSTYGYLWGGTNAERPIYVVTYEK